MSDLPPQLRAVPVWDVPTRLFHWSLVILFAFSWWSGEQGGSWMRFHFWSGYAILTLVLFRIAWGLVGSRTARFSDFLKGPRAGLHHLGELLRPGKTSDIGHNPVGGWMVLLLLVLLVVQTVTGLFAEDRELNAGPLSLWVSQKTSHLLTEIHETVVNILLLLIGAHVVAVLAYLVFKRDNLIGAMFSGRKQLQLAPGQEPRMASPYLALALVVVCALAVIALVRFA
jgi:cytochrome b